MYFGFTLLVFVILSYIFVFLIVWCLFHYFKEWIPFSRVCVCVCVLVFNVCNVGSGHACRLEMKAQNV